MTGIKEIQKIYFYENISRVEMDFFHVFFYLKKKKIV